LAIRFLALAAAACAVLSTPSGALAEDADHYRGGWRTDVGDPAVYEFVIDGQKVSGIYCTQCSDGTTLAVVEGSFDEQGGLVFTVRHLDRDGSLASEDRLSARLDDGKLYLTGKRGADGGRIEQVAIKDPRGPTPGPYPQTRLPPGSPPVQITKPSAAGGGGPPAPYVQPAPWRQLTADDVAGVWLGFGVGRNKQYFLIRKAGDELFGLACGPCDNPYTMGALDHFAIHGDTLEFDIEHQDWGEGSHVPFVRHVTAHIAMNEMRIDARRADMPGSAPIVASLLGPIAIEATESNRPSE
jgi:hypothetical protein